MKKNLFVLSALALATASSQAYTLLESKETGTKIDLTGSARLVWKSTSEKVHANGETHKEHINHAVANNGTRFGFKLKQEFDEDFYALGRVEWRFRGKAPSQHDFDDIYTRQLYAGIGSYTFGELTYGHQFTIADEVKQTDLGNTLSLSDGLLNGFERKSIQYVYNVIDGLKFGGFYGDHSKRSSNGLDRKNKRKDVMGAGVIYDYKFADNQHARFGTGMTRERSFNRDHSLFNYTAYSFGTAYTYGKTTVGLDLERGETKNKGIIGNKDVQKEVRTVLEYKFIPELRAYTMYAYKMNTRNVVNSRKQENKTHQFMVGTEYYFIPKYVKGFVEAATSRTKQNISGENSSKTRDNVVAIGVRAYW